MGKAKKSERKLHANHHDNPRHKSNGIVRRSHSQTVSKKLGSSKLQGPRAGLRATARPRVLFTKFDHVLCVGEGDFSFALSLAACFNVKQLVATCYDDEGTLQRKYPQAQRIIARLLSADAVDTEPSLYGEDDSEWQGLSPPPPVIDDRSPDISAPITALKAPHFRRDMSSNPHRSVYYAINATKLSSTHSKHLRARSPFTKIVFNFPHVGGLSTDVNRQVRANQELLVGFFKSAIPLLASAERPLRTGRARGGDVENDGIYADGDEGSSSDSSHEDKGRTVVMKGQILVTLFEGEPYTLWNVRDLARHSGLRVIESFRFPWEAYPGYAHARTVGEITTGKDRTAEGKRKGAWRGEERDARCYVLEVKDDDKVVDGRGVGTEANSTDLGVRKGKRKGIARGSDSGSGSD